MKNRGLRQCRRGAAAAEFALALPLLMVILAGAIELGFYLYSEHRLVEAVRDGARYASRQPFSEFATCSGWTPSSTLSTNTKRIVQKGSLDSSDPDLLWGWGETGESFTMTLSCVSAVSYSGNNVTMDGIYADSTSGAPVVTVRASIPHQSVFVLFGFDPMTQLNARGQAAVMGI
ncbi:TadE/TadG family type IV pilus assembly protein [Sphingomicrobium nitratireducens]|uniref:TadE/TadG family type IV pilus assembly protein n=1 Tax=Sphingomicrobium nitratireducens TaxID=2964666 RepID=UPI00223F2FCB|nr:TadE/TadG family type IV pilus assembly protein [Sphingomicrobium nitratireducens]